MPSRKKDEVFTGWTKKSYLEYMRVQLASKLGSEIKMWDMSVYNNAIGSCMDCGCPKEDSKMKSSPSPYICSLCFKKKYGADEYNRLMKIMAPVQDNEVTIDEIFKHVYKILETHVVR
jgi:hypothetical protein